MKDRDTIIKGLECCKTPLASDCKNCSYSGERNEDGVYEGCVNCLVADALELIKELTEKNERLRNWCENKIVLDNDELKEVKTACLERIKLDVKRIKTDTVREFAEKLKKGFRKYDRANWAVRAIIDQIVKEMLEE